MVNPDIKKYILNSRDKNLSESEIRTNLKTVGWDAQDIEDTFKTLEKPSVPNFKDANSEIPRPVSSLSAHPRGNMWDSFEHVLMFLSMFGVTAYTGNLLHQFIDGPDMGMNRSYGMNIIGWIVGNYHTLIRIYISILLVCTPLFVILFLDISKRTLKHHEIRKLRMRKLLIYITLVTTFIMSISKVIALVYNVLGGSINGVYFLHFVVTVGIAGAVFVYYLYQVREDRLINTL